MFPFLFRETTRHLLIRRMHPDDWKDLYAYLSDPEVVLYEPYDVYNRDDAILEAANRANSPYFLAVCLLTNGRMIGNLYAAPKEVGVYEFGYIFNRRYHGKNYAYESSKAIIHYLWKNPEIQRIIAECDARNKRSIHLMKRLEMCECDRYLGEDYTGKDENTEHIVYNLIRSK